VNVVKEQFACFRQTVEVPRRSTFNRDLIDDPVPRRYVRVKDEKSNWWFATQRYPDWKKLCAHVDDVWVDPKVINATNQLGQLKPNGHQRMSQKQYLSILFERLIGGLPGKQRAASIYHTVKQRSKKEYVRKLVSNHIGRRSLTILPKSMTPEDAANVPELYLDALTVSPLMSAIRGESAIRNLITKINQIIISTHQTCVLYFCIDHWKRTCEEKGLTPDPSLEQGMLESYLTTKIVHFGNYEFKRWADNKKFHAKPADKHLYDTDQIDYTFAKSK